MGAQQLPREKIIITLAATSEVTLMALKDLVMLICQHYILVEEGTSHKTDKHITVKEFSEE